MNITWQVQELDGPGHRLLPSCQTSTAGNVSRCTSASIEREATKEVV